MSAATVVIPPAEASPVRAVTTMVASFAEDELEIIKGARFDHKPPWEGWERNVQEHTKLLRPSSDAAGAVVAAKGTTTPQPRGSDNDLVYAMPTIFDRRSIDFENTSVTVLTSCLHLLSSMLRNCLIWALSP